jgi:hypothetical protein
MTVRWRTTSVNVESGYAPALAETVDVQSLAHQDGFAHGIPGPGRSSVGACGVDLKTHAASPIFTVRLIVNWTPMLFAAARPVTADDG